jgi:hypothetical protein
VLEPPTTVGGGAVRALVVASVAVELGEGRAADAVRAAPLDWQLCCEASRAEGAAPESAGAARVDAPPPTCVGLGLGALPAVPLPGRGGAGLASDPAPSRWRLEAWLERAHQQAGGRRLGPRAVVGLTAIEIVG